MGCQPDDSNEAVYQTAQRSRSQEGCKWILSTERRVTKPRIGVLKCSFPDVVYSWALSGT